MRDYKNLEFSFGDQELVGQQRTRQRLTKVIKSDRISHAYLFSGPKGIGKKAFAMAFAELLNGVSNITSLGEQKFSKKSSWFTHPDIHLFLPMPSSYKFSDLTERLELLKEDPYDIVDFSLRPSLSDEDSSKNLRAFYPIDYFRDDIRPVARLKPNEGEKTVIIISNIEQMRERSANAFLKLLEEPSEDLIFILTTDNQQALLPTIISRCQLISMSPLKTSEIRDALIQKDGYDKEDAQYLARISGGNYSLTKFFDIENLKAIRDDVVSFLREAYQLNTVKITDMAAEWNKNQTREAQIAILNTMEVFIHDLLTYRESGNSKWITNFDQIDSIKNFVANIPEARLTEMISTIHELRPNLQQYVQAKIVFTVLGIRFFYLMRDKDPEISQENNWKHIPAYIPT